LRFVDGRPVSALTTPYLAWCCAALQALGKQALLLIWDNTAWHVSREVRTWIRRHNRKVKLAGSGVRILLCYLPIKSPWLSPIEPKWVHGKRRVVEPARLLPAAELIGPIPTLTLLAKSARAPSGQAPAGSRVAAHLKRGECHHVAAP
jgi:hypothetical protein